MEAAEAATPDTAMFAAPPDAGEDASSSITGRRRFPSTRPTSASGECHQEAPDGDAYRFDRDTREECSSRAPGPR